MSISSCFSANYAEARAKFREAARAAGARLAALTHPSLSGPRGEELSIDVAVSASRDTDRALLVISGTHGVEGFCGSGCQVALLQNGFAQAFSERTALIFVHALNPYGFAWCRRVNEDGVDLNRNFVDFSAPLPASTEYERLHEWLVPEEWTGEHRQNADAQLGAYAAQHGLRAYQAAVSSGQYSRPTGLFFGGSKPTWSADSLRKILEGLSAAGSQTPRGTRHSYGPGSIRLRRADQPGQRYRRTASSSVVRPRGDEPGRRQVGIGYGGRFGR